MSLVRAMASACGLRDGLWDGTEHRDGLAVRVVDRAFRIGAGAPAAALEVERVAQAFVAATAFDRARAMMAAASVADPPLWLVRGSPALAAYLRWARRGAQFASGLTLSPGLDGGPLVGGVALRVRRDGRVGSARLVVRRGTASGIAVLGERPRSTLTFASGPRLVVVGAQLPETVAAGTDPDAGAIARPLEALVDHPFVRGAGLRVRGFESAGGRVEIALKGGWTTLAPVPPEALAVVPPDAEPSAPWRATEREVGTLDELAAAGALSFGGA